MLSLKSLNGATRQPGWAKTWAQLEGLKEQCPAKLLETDQGKKLFFSKMTIRLRSQNKGYQLKLHKRKPEKCSPLI